MSSTIDSSPVAPARASLFRRTFSGVTPTGTQSTLGLFFRRLTMATLVLGTSAALTAAFWTVMNVDGWSIPEMAMFVCFVASLPWIVIGFWNGVIGLALLRFARDPLDVVIPCAARVSDDEPITSRAAIVMCIRHEDSQRVVRRLDAILRSLDATGFGDAFDVHVLSDTTREDFAADEREAIEGWRAGLVRQERVFYRRRPVNTGFKAGNIREFLLERGDDYEVMITLDADSVMSGPTILRLVRVMQANPKLGILQSLVVGLPARTAFARMFQFGMRASMRSYTMGAAWWSADCGPYWGHNAAIRVAPFRDHAELPELPGAPPLGGVILSHDQVEAVLIRRAGYEVCVLPEESGSWEDNPTSLPDFLRRNLRWCQGNMQYVKLLGMPGLRLISRVQLLLAILMYVSAPAWIGFMIAGAAQAFGPPSVIGDLDPPGSFPVGLSIGLFLTMLFLTFTPKLMGYLDVVMSDRESARYGGTGPFVAGTAAELFFGFLLAPVVSFSVTVFLIFLLGFGASVGWEAQDRDGHRVGWLEAASKLWPATLFGVALTVTLAYAAPQVLLWASPVLASFLLAVPFTVITSTDALGALAARSRLGATPEEMAPPAEVRAVSDSVPATVRYGAPLAPFRLDGGETGGRLRAMVEEPAR
ncbi:glucans biosynthesis glucosyltransferase MdoH [Methylopila henanensis]|uniref:Glucans biosynthesis glucosyltransferase H n=1 Tax=Methylopila henanensis TaxID=873516 RepID=A0ABW4K7N2_9HYPH